MGIAPASFSAFCRKITKARPIQVEKQLAGFGVEDLSTDGNSNGQIFAIFPMSIRTFAVPSTFCAVFGVISEVKQGIQPIVGFKPDIASAAAIATGRAATRNELFTPERRDAVSTVAGFYQDLRTVDEHNKYFSCRRRPGKTGFGFRERNEAQKTKASPQLLETMPSST